MALKARKRVEPHWYTPEDQEEEPSPARFKIRALNASEQLDVVNTFVNGKPGVAAFQLCFRTCCIEIEGVEDDRGKPIRTAHKFMLQHDFRDYVAEVGAAAFEKSFLTEDEEKNS